MFHILDIPLKAPSYNRGSGGRCTVRKEEKEKGSQKSKGEEGSNPKIDYALIGSVCSLTLSIWSFPQRKIKPREGKTNTNSE